VRVPPVQRRRSFGIRGWLIAAAVIIVVLLLSARGLARIYTDYLWFKEVHFSHTWRQLIEAKAFPALIFSLVFFVLLYVDLVIADRLAPVARSAGPEDEIIERYRNVVVPYAGRIRLVVAAFFSIVMASGVASEWRDWVLFKNATDFGVKDPQFHRDISFFTWDYPAYRLMLSFGFTAIIFAVTPCVAQTTREDRAAAVKIDRIVNQQMLANKIPGVSLAILRKGKIILLKSYGFANVEHQVPVKPDTVFQSGSIGKQFTAAAVMLLVQDNKLSLDDRISKYFPDVPATWKDITLWNLLTHTSGLGDYPPEIDLKRDYSEDELLAAFKNAPLDFEPGSSWNYSNAGYAMLGILIRKITGEYYGDFIRKRIFR